MKINLSRGNDCLVNHVPQFSQSMVPYLNDLPTPPLPVRGHHPRRVMMIFNLFWDLSYLMNFLLSKG